MGTEKLKFKLELYATSWDRLPIAKIKIDDQIHIQTEITGTEDKPNVIEFEHEFEEDSEHNLIIDYIFKTVDQTKRDADGKVLADQMLHIKSIEIDEIDIGALVYEAVYTPIYPEPWATQQRQAGNELPESFKNVTSMGHNGTWRFKFTSPWYMWLLENLY